MFEIPVKNFDLRFVDLNQFLDFIPIVFEIAVPRNQKEKNSNSAQSNRTSDLQIILKIIDPERCDNKNKQS